MQALFFAIATVLLWGVAPVVEKVALREVDVLPAVCIRSFAVSSLLMLYLTATRGFGGLSGLPWRVYILIIIGGTCASLIGQVTFFKTLSADQASLAVPFVATFPMITTLGALLFLGESLTPRKAIGIAFAIMGAYMLTTVKPPPADARPIRIPPAQTESAAPLEDSAQNAM